MLKRVLLLPLAARAGLSAQAFSKPDARSGSDHRYLFGNPLLRDPGGLVEQNWYWRDFDFNMNVGWAMSRASSQGEGSVNPCFRPRYRNGISRPKTPP